MGGEPKEIGREQALAWTKSLRFDQLIAFLYDAMKLHPYFRKHRLRAPVLGYSFLTMDYRGKKKPLVWSGKWDIHYYGLPDIKSYGHDSLQEMLAEEPAANDIEPSETGDCSLCRHEVDSWRKSAVCPVCGKPVYLT